MTTMSYGYVNRTIEGGRKAIVPREPEAENLRWTFEQVAKGINCIDDIRKALNKKELRCSKSYFYTILKNPVCGGRIRVPTYCDEP